MVDGFGKNNDRSKGTNDSESLFGRDVSDTFNSENGDDIIKDFSTSDDMFIFKKGDGNDVIFDKGGNDRIIFDESVIKEDIKYSKSKDLNSLIISYSDTDSIMIDQFFNPYFNYIFQIENIELSDGTVLDLVSEVNLEETDNEIIFNSQTIELNEDTSYENTIILAGNIEDVTYKILENTSNGSFTLNSDGTYTYVPNSNYSGTDIITLSVTNKYGETATSTLTFDVLEINDAPEIEVITEVVTKEDAVVITGQIEASDVDVNAVLTFSTTQVVPGFTLNSDGSYSFDSSVEEYQSLSQWDVKEIIISVSVSDENNAVDTKDLVIKVEGTNDTPIATADVGSVEENGTLTLSAIEVLSNDVDVDSNDVLTITKVLAPTNKGNASLDDNGDVVFTTGNDFDYLAVGEVEEVVLSYEISDDKGASSSSTITVTVTGTNDAPVITNPYEKSILRQEIVKEGKIEVLDIDGDVLTFSVLETPKHGELAVDQEGNWIYNIDTTYKGLDFAKILINDGNGGKVVKTINFDIQNKPINGNNWSNYIFSSYNEKDIINGLGGNDYIYVINNKDNMIFAGDGKDTINAGSGNELLDGGSGDDRIYSSYGDDYLEGSYGNDTYIFNLGDGHDTIYDYERYQEISNDKIVLSGAINLEDIDFIRINNDLLISIDENNSINIQNWYAHSDSYKIEKIEKIELTDSGLSLGIEEIESFSKIVGNNYNNRIKGSNDNDRIYGFAGNDTIDAYSGNDFIVGGIGDDRLYGSYGEDTYFFSKGDGMDYIYDYGYDMDTIKFDETVNKEDIIFFNKSRDLILDYGVSDSILIKKQKYSYNSIEKVELSDGSYLSI
jgi:VCBS repeat-containing protein